MCGWGVWWGAAADTRVVVATRRDVKLEKRVPLASDEEEEEEEKQ